MGSAAMRMVNLRPWTELTPQRESWLVDGLIKALPDLRMAELFALRRDMFRDADLITVAVDETDTAVGALSSRWHTLGSDQRFLHITTQFVGEAHRQGGVFRRSWATHLSEIGGPDFRDFPSLLVLKTYNPMVLSSFRTLRRIPRVSVFPDIEGVPSAATVRTACAVAHLIAPDHPFDPETGVITGAGVPADLYPNPLRSADDSVNRYFATCTHPGDRVLCMLEVSTRPAVLAMMRLFSRVSTAALRVDTVVGGARV